MALAGARGKTPADADASLAERLARHQTPEGPSKEYLNDGRCLEVSEYATSEGGAIVLVRDITGAERREAVRILEDARSRAIIDTVLDGVIMINDEGMVETFNPAAERIFGYGADEVAGRNVSLLMNEPEHGEHDTYLSNYLEPGDAQIIGKGREVTGRRNDGPELPMDLAIRQVGVAGKPTAAMGAITGAGGAADRTYAAWDRPCRAANRRMIDRGGRGGGGARSGGGRERAQARRQTHGGESSRWMVRVGRSGVEESAAVERLAQTVSNALDIVSLIFQFLSGSPVSAAIRISG